MNRITHPVGDSGMAWKQTIITVMAEGLRFFGRACVLIDVILVSVFSVWLVSKTLWHAAAWLNRTVFSGSW